MMKRKSKNSIRSIHIHDKNVITFVEQIAEEFHCPLYEAVERIIRCNLTAPSVRFEYGDKVCDTLTGYEGRITAICSYYGTKPDQYLLESIDSTGRPVDWWIEEERLEAVKESEE